MLPLSKGIFRIALQAKSIMPDTPLYIVPVGVRYGNFFRFRSTVRIQVGEPINIGSFRQEHSDLNEQEQMGVLRTLLEERMKNAIFYIPNDEDYDATYEICAAVVKNQVRQLKKDENGRRLRGLDAHFTANKKTLKEITQLKEKSPEVASHVLQLGNEASLLRRKNRISLSSVSVKYPLLSRLLMTLFIIVTLPYNLVASILTLPINAIGGYLFTLLKDPAFRNSVRYILNLVLWPLLMIIYSIVAYAVLPWQWALPVTLALLPAPIIAHETWRLFRLMRSDIKLMTNRELRAKYREIRRILNKNRRTKR